MYQAKEKSENCRSNDRATAIEGANNLFACAYSGIAKDLNDLKTAPSLTAQSLKGFPDFQIIDGGMPYRIDIGRSSDLLFGEAPTHQVAFHKTGENRASVALE